jgi:hypothetical protein
MSRRASWRVAGVILQYDAFAQIAHDIDDARVYGGIHFRFDHEAGGKLGRRSEPSDRPGG